LGIGAEALDAVFACRQLLHASAQTGEEGARFGPARG